jgi:hypothetical protein
VEESIKQLNIDNMNKLFILALTLVMMTGCAGRIGKKTDRLVNDGHDYQWIMFYDRTYMVHSPECDSCKAMRKQEIKEVVDELLKDK